MKVTWLGDAGLLLRSEKILVAVDPTVEIPSPDVLVLTHAHPDALDMGVVGRLLAGGRVTVLASEGVFERIAPVAGENNLVLLAPGTVYSVLGVTFYSVPSAHSDRTAVGVIIDDGERTYYASGDTLYNYDVIDSVLELAPDGVDVAFLSISGRDCNMNARDAADFAYEIGAGVAVPVRHGATDPAAFDFEDALVLAVGEERDI